MDILFGLLVLILIAAGLYFQRRQRKQWIAEERYEESGDWLDKRAGERGAYGSLDAEREQERKTLTAQGRVVEAGRLLRDYFFEHFPGFDALNDAQLKTFTGFAREQTAQVMAEAENLLKGRLPESHEPSAETDAHVQALKKIMLDFTYRHFPELLELDIEQIKQLDLVAEAGAKKLLKKVDELGL